MLEGDYPYTSGATGDDTTDCLYSASEATNVDVISYAVADGYYTGNLMAAVAKQPIAVIFAANNAYIHSYASGVIDADDCY